jgi:hypothetical protein
MDDGSEEWPEEQAYFTGCTCEHEPDRHGYGCCNVPDCECEGGWEE